MTSSSNKYSGGESGTGHSTSDFQFPMNSSGPAVDSKPPASGRQHGAGQSSLDSSTGGRNGVFHYRSTISPRSSSVSPRGANIYSAAGMLGTSAVSMFSNPAAVPMYSIPFGSTGSTIGVGGGTKQISGSLIRDNREKEKRELCELNDRFANYVERVRFLEALNKKLKLEADALKSRLGKNGDKIKNMYETELREARKLIDETMKNQKDLVLKTQRADDDGNRIRDRYEQLVKSSDDERLKMAHLSKELAENEATLCLLNRRVADLDEEAKRYKAESHALAQDLQRANSDLYHEAGMRIQLQNDKQSLEEELSFIKQIHAQEMEELKDMLSRDSTLDPSKFFQHELSSAIKDIRKEYDTLNQQQKQEMENWYRMKVTNAVQELQAKKLSETKHLPRDEDIKSLHQQITGIKKDSLLSRQKNHELEYKVHELQRLLEQEKDDGSKTVNSCNQVIFDLQMKLDQMLNDYEQLLSNNSNLNSEISLYRKLLEGGENDRSGLKHIVEGIERSVIGDWTGDRTMAALSSQSKPDIDEHAMEAEEHGKSEEEEEEEEDDEMPIDERVKETGQTREGERRWGEIKEVMTREPFSKIARAVTFKPTEVKSQIDGYAKSNIIRSEIVLRASAIDLRDTSTETEKSRPQSVPYGSSRSHESVSSMKPPAWLSKPRASRNHPVASHGLQSGQIPRQNRETDQVMKSDQLDDIVEERSKRIWTHISRFETGMNDPKPDQKNMSTGGTVLDSRAAIQESEGGRKGGVSTIPSIPTSSDSDTAIYQSSADEAALMNLSLERSFMDGSVTEVEADIMNATMDTTADMLEYLDEVNDNHLEITKMAKGPIHIDHCMTNGHYIIVRNSSTDTQMDLSQWKIIQTDKDEKEADIKYNFGSVIAIPGREIRLVASSAIGKVNCPPGSVICQHVSSWSKSLRSITVLIDKEGMVRSDYCRHVKRG